MYDASTLVGKYHPFRQDPTVKCLVVEGGGAEDGVNAA